MWLIVTGAIFVVAYFILRRILDRETARNLAFLAKIALVILGLFIVLSLIIYINQR